MGQLAFTLPTLGQPNNTEDPDIVNALSAIKSVINGQLDTGNLSPTAAIKYSQLAADAIEQLQSASMPTGSIISYGGSTAPNGFRLCQGQALSRTAFSNLYDVVQTKYGAGDGSTTFNLPDLRARVPVGLASGNLVHGALGQKEGTDGPTDRSSYHKHPHPHTHGMNFNTSGPSNQVSLQFATGAGFPNVYPIPDHVHLVNGTTAGVNTALTDVASPAYQVINYIIKT